MAGKGQAKTGGRKKGSANKSTVAVKQALEAAFERLGGVEALAEWAEENKTEFYKLFAKLLPLQVQGDVNSNLTIKVVSFKDLAE